LSVNVPSAAYTSIIGITFLLAVYDEHHNSTRAYPMTSVIANGA